MHSDQTPSVDQIDLELTLTKKVTNIQLPKVLGDVPTSMPMIWDLNLNECCILIQLFQD